MVRAEGQRDSAGTGEARLASQAAEDSTGADAQGLPPVSLRIVQPEYLSLVAPNPLTLHVVAANAASLHVRLTALDEEGRLSVPLASCAVRLISGANAVSFTVAPELLAPFSSGETVTLRAEAGGVLAETDITALYAEASPEAAAWALSAPSPVQLSTSAASTVPLVATNPKTTTKNALVKLQFMDARGKHKVKPPAVPAVLAPGDNALAFSVSASEAALALGSGDTRCKATLVVGGIVRGSVTVPLDFDLSASAAGDPLSGQAPLTVHFTGTVSAGQSPYTYAWDFGDGDTSLDQSPDHAYATAGNYSAHLTVTDGLGGRATSSDVGITVVQPLVAQAAAAPTEGTAPLAVTFTGSASGGLPPYSYAWDFGDGQASAVQSPAHSYTVAGTNDAHLTVSDALATTATAGVTVTVHLLARIESLEYTILNQHSTIVDADGNGVFDAAALAPCNDGPISFTLHPSAAGTFTFLAPTIPGLTLDPATGVGTYAPACSLDGTDISVPFSLLDNQGGYSLPVTARFHAQQLAPVVEVLGLDTDAVPGPEVVPGGIASSPCTTTLEGMVLATGTGTLSVATPPPGFSSTGDGHFSFSPSCDLAGQSFSSSMWYTDEWGREGAHAAFTFAVPALVLPRIVSMSWDNGVAQGNTVDADGNNVFDVTPDTYCGYVVLTTATITGTPGSTLHAEPLPAGVGFDTSLGLLTIAADCNLAGQTLPLQFYATDSFGRGPNMVANYHVVELPPVQHVMGLDTDPAPGLEVLPGGTLIKVCLEDPLAFTVASDSSAASTLSLDGSVPGLSVVDAAAHLVQYDPSCADLGTYHAGFRLIDAFGRSGPASNFTFVVSKRPSIVGLDYNNDGVADNIDANGDGTLDDLLNAQCGTSTLSYLISKDVTGTPIYTLLDPAPGMSVQGNALTIDPACAQTGQYVSRVKVTGTNGTSLEETINVNIYQQLRIVGIDYDNDGITDNVDANGDGGLDNTINTSCNAPFPYEWNVIAIPPGQYTYFATDLPQGMDFSQGTGHITFDPACNQAGLDYTVGLTVSDGITTSSRVYVPIHVTQ
jgi:PKD repeat protein